MASNFDFLKNIDNELFEIIEEAQNLFRSEYFNQSVIQTRIYAEKMAKKILANAVSAQTFDDILNNLKDRAQSISEKEFVEDLFFIKKQGNKCAHGETLGAKDALEVIKRAFEAGINWSKNKTKDKKTIEKINGLLFDETLLITAKPEENSLVKKYLERIMPSETAKAQENKEQIREALLNNKQGEFLSGTKNMIDDYEIGNFEGLKDKYGIADPNRYKKETGKKRGRKKEINPKKEEIKEKIKKAKKNLKENINKIEKPPEKNIKKVSEKNSSKKKKKKPETFDTGAFKAILFLVFVLISLALLIELIFNC